MRKRILSLLLSLVLMGCFCLTASAHEVPDADRLGSISIAMTYHGRPISGGSLTIYRVADVVSDNGDMIFVYTEVFEGCSIPVTKLESSRLPEELARIARRSSQAGTTQRLDRHGKTKFADLEIGLSLVVQQEAASGYTRINPFLVFVPHNDNGHYIYDVDSAPKNIPEPEVKPTEPPKPAEPPIFDDKLPQTGQTNWPVPVMAAVGLLLLTCGFCLRVSGKRKQNEA